MNISLLAAKTGEAQEKREYCNWGDGYGGFCSKDKICKVEDPTHFNIDASLLEKFISERNEGRFDKSGEETDEVSYIVAHNVPRGEPNLYVAPPHDVDPATYLIDSIWDLPRQNALSKESRLCGYVEKDGTYHKCGSCEHTSIIRKIVKEKYLDLYFDADPEVFEKMPFGMLQEEYFAMKALGFAKISSFDNTPNDMVVFFYDNLTPEQAALIYPK